MRMEIESEAGMVPESSDMQGRGIRCYSISCYPFNHGIWFHRISTRAIDLNFDVPDSNHEVGVQLCRKTAIQTCHHSFDPNEKGENVV